jgi:hypothetical protein
MSGAVRSENRGQQDAARARLIESIQRSLALEIQEYEVGMA